MAKKKFESLDAIFDSPKHVKTLSSRRYKSNYNYENIDLDDVEKLTSSEEDIIISKDEIGRGYLKIAKSLSEANKILASYDNTSGKFISWFENLGLKRTFVYNSMKRYELYLLVDNEEKINKLSQKAIEILGSKKIENTLKIKLLKEDGIERLSDRELKKYITKTISERSEMIEEKSNIEMATIIDEPISIEEKEKYFYNIKKLLTKVEKKLSEEITSNQLQKLKRIEEILKEI